MIQGFIFYMMQEKGKDKDIIARNRLKTEGILIKDLKKNLC